MGVRRLYIRPRRDVAQMESICGFRPGHECDCSVRLDSRCRVSGHVPVMHRSIFSDPLYCPNPAEGRRYVTELFYLCLYGEVVRAGVRLELPLCLIRAVVG